MTEETLSPDRPVTKPRAKLPRWAIIVGVSLATLLLVWLLRTMIAGAWLQLTCGAQKLKCEFDISRLDAGGLTIRNLKIVGADPSQPPLSAGKIAVDLAWRAPWDVRAKAVASEGAALRLDLREGKPLLGELQGLLDPYLKAKPSAKPTVRPFIDFKTVSIIIQTDAGPVEIGGHFLAPSPDDFSLDLAAKPARIGYQGAELDLKTARLKASASGRTLTGVLNLDLARFKSKLASVEALKVDAVVDQTADALKGHATAAAHELMTEEGGVTKGDAVADFVALPIDLADMTAERLLTRLRSLKLHAQAEEGTLLGAAWKQGVIDANIDPTSTSNAEGKLAIALSSIEHVLGKADRLNVAGDLNVVGAGATGKVRLLTASGAAKVTGAAMADGPSRILSRAILGMLKSNLPDFADQLDKASKSAGERFDFSAPWSFKIDDGGFDAAALSGVKLQARSGFSCVIERTGAQEVFAFSQRGAPAWRAAGMIRASGGGAPQIELALSQASGDGANVTAAGGAEVKPWKLKDDTLSLKASGLEFAREGAAGRASADVVVSYDGALAGGVFDGAKAQGAVKAAWTDKAFAADAPRGLEVSWRQAKFDKVSVGAGALHYAPNGHLAERRGEGIGGSGRILELTMPVSGSDFTASGKLGAIAINWTAAETTNVNFDFAPSSFEFKPSEGSAMSGGVGGVRGSVRLARGWTLEGAFSGGEAKTDPALVRNLAGKFKLAGDDKGMGGDVTDVALHIVDPHETEGRAFEDIHATGEAKLAKGRIDFNAALTLASNSVSLGSITGSHELDKAAGEARLQRTTLVFAPGTFQPYRLSPLLRGPANVGGKVSYQGGVRWSGDQPLRSFADLELSDLGFSLAQAGVFENVDGRVHIDDIPKLTSPPGQTVTVGKITLGLPIENGVIKFQLAGTKSINLENAAWPFVGGQLRIQPLTFSLEPGATNGVIAEAVNWDMNSLVELFQLRDLKLKGHIGGKLPVAFTTGSAKIVNAKLDATTEGGVVQYVGSTGEAAGNADQSAKILFDALEDFRFEVMQVTIDGDIAKRITLGAKLRGWGMKPNRSFYEFNLAIDSELMDLLQIGNRAQPTLNQITGGRISGSN